MARKSTPLEASAVPATVTKASGFSVIRDKTKLADFIDATLNLYHDVGDRLHVAVVSCLWHVATHGNPALLNKLFAGLRVNDQNTVRLYVRRAAIYIGLNGESPNGLEREVIQAAFVAGQVLDMKNKQFFVVRGHTSPEAKALAALCEGRLINPDGDEDKKVFERNNITEHQTLGDEDVLKNLLRTVDQALKDSTERKTIDVSPAVRKFFEELKTEATAFFNKVTLDKG